MAPMAAPIRYQVLYKDAEGKVIKEGPYSSTNPGVKEDPEDFDESAPSILDIIIHVTIRDIVETKTINSEAAAAKAGAEAEEANVAVEAVTGEAKSHPYKISKVNASVMVIRSPSLITAFRKIVKYYPTQTLTAETITVEEPYYFVLHHLKDLENYVDEQDEENKAENQEVANGVVNGVNEETSTKASEEKEPPCSQLRHDFRVLKTFLEPKWGKKIERELERHKQNPPVATFEMLWMLMKPGTRAFAFHQNESENEFAGGWIVRGVSASHEANKYMISLWKLDFDGEYLDRGLDEIGVESWEGEREISTATMDPCPVEININGKMTQVDHSYEEKLLKRGEKFIKFITTIFEKKSLEVTYTGDIVGEAKLKFYNGNAIIDPASYMNSANSTSYDRFTDDDDAYPRDLALQDEYKLWGHYQNICADSMKEFPTTFHEGHFFLCPPSIGGFLTRRREFFRMTVDNISPYTIDKDVLKSLQIPQDRLKLITALTHRFDDGEKSWSADFIQSKGEGLIFLLHGPSGVGKTYTAECIAMYTGRPLLSLTVADIGTNEAEMEKELAKWFNLSETWGAIMLIDEADVYFERRASGQLQRNSLVSAFLRSMEYYRGILFLTTNRLGHIDDAIISRIHLVIEYKDLTDEDRMKIWRQFFAKLSKDKKNYEVDDYLESFVENNPKILNLKWNGREIRNAFQTAVALAEYAAKTADPPKQRVIVRKSHLEGVAEMSVAFKQYMKDFKGDADKRAYIEGARMDDTIRRKKSQLEVARKAARENRGQ